MDFSTAWVFFAALTFAIVALVVVFASSSSKRSGRSRERAERETGQNIEPAHRERPQNLTRSEADVSGRDGPV